MSTCSMIASLSADRQIRSGHNAVKQWRNAPTYALMLREYGFKVSDFARWYHAPVTRHIASS